MESTQTHPRANAGSQPLVNVLTKYERTKIVGIRAEQLARGAQPMIDIERDSTFDPYAVAEQELLSRRLPFVVVRTMPDGRNEHVRLDQLRVDTAF